MYVNNQIYLKHSWAAKTLHSNILANTHTHSHMMESSYYSHHNHINGSEQPEKKMFLFC